MPHPQPHRRWRNALLATALVALAAFTALGIAVAPGPLPIDLTAASALAPFHVGITGVAIDFVNLAGQTFVLDPLVGLLGLALWSRGRRAAAMILVLGLLGAETGATVAKLLVGRERPGGFEVWDLVTQASYPSGHVTRTVVAAGLLVGLAWRRMSRSVAIATAVGVVVLMAISRVAVGAHWFTDTVGATLFGIAALAFIGVVVDLAPTRAHPSPS